MTQIRLRKDLSVLKESYFDYFRITFRDFLINDSDIYWFWVLGTLNDVCFLEEYFVNLMI